MPANIAIAQVAAPIPDPPPAPLAKADLLAGLDAQIKFVSEAQRNEGWTRWAIWCALAAFLWHGTELVTRSDFALSRGVLTSFAVFIIWAVLESLLSLIAPISRVGSAAPLRFHLWPDLVSVVRPGVIASALRQVLIIVALATFHYPGQWPLWTYAIISLSADLMIFAPVMSNITFPTRLGLRTAFTLTTLVPLAWLIFAGFHVAQPIQQDVSNFSLADVRFGLLLNATAYLLIRLATTTSSSHVLGELTELRQHLAFDRLAVTEATRQAETLLTGLKLADVLNPSVDRVLKESQELAQMLKRTTETLDQLRAQDSLGGNDAIAANLRRLDELDNEKKRLAAKLKVLARARSRFQVRALCIAIYSRECLPELKAPVEKVQAAFAQGKKGVADFTAQLAAFKNQTNELVKNSDIQ